jgi:predicted neuraminidase
MTDAEGKLFLFWPIILANTWESCLTRCLVSEDPQGAGSPVWSTNKTLFLKPDDFSGEATQKLDELLANTNETLSPGDLQEIELARQRLSDKLYQRLGWQPRCKPTVLPSGRILLPLYSDTFSFSLMAISDDAGESWFSSRPLLGFGAIQPAVVRRNDGTLVAYMRENGPFNKIRTAESTDDGMTWAPVGVIDLPNPGSGLDAVRLTTGEWLLVYNDSTTGRNTLAVSLSSDEGHTWNVTQHLEKHETGSYHYPVIIQSRDGLIHVVYSYFVDGGKSMKHAVFNKEWILAK